MNDGASEGPPHRDFEIINKRGLHARAAARFVQTVEKFDATVVVSKDGQSVGGDSIMGLMMLGAAMGTSIRVSATGREAEGVLEAVADLLASGFGEED
jgi:phosphocarrier protein